MGLGLSVTAVSSPEKKKSSSVRGPLAQDFTIAIKAPGNNHREGYIYFNGFARLSDNSFLALAVIDQPEEATAAGVNGYQGRVILSRSDDGGESWKVLNTNLDFGRRMIGGALFVYDNALYLFATPKDDDGIIRVARSDDRGATWSEWVEVLRVPRQVKPDSVASGVRPTTDDDPNWSDEQKWIAYLQTSMAVWRGHLYFAVSERCQDMAIVSCNLKNGLLNPDSWRISKTMPVSIPKELNPGFFPGPSMSTLEGNVIVINGQLRLLARQVVDRYGTSNIAAVFDVKENNGRPELSFVQFFPVPGAHGLFNVVFDAESRLFWMASNLESNSQKWIKSPSGSHKGRDRRFLMLWYSLDALNWFPAGCIAAAEKMQQTFNYPSMIIDGDDLAIVSRTTLDADKYTSHDADHVTFHRVRDFRSLAMNIHPAP
ncbi:MAG TPA: hypothetical protein DD670_00535 [Planctomycetaceae bacterium]|nr:hypothetical protein [Planctomycetaceae bacterium]